MLEYVFRFSIPNGKQGEFIEWVNVNDEAFNEHNAEGWTYLGTWLTVVGLGESDAETRWTVDDYGALGNGFGDEEGQRQLAKFLGEYVDYSQPRHVSLMRSSKTVQSLAGM